jgi:hypothetical protein
MESSVVPAGAVPVTIEGPAIASPKLNTVIVYVRLLPEVTGSGDATTLTIRSGIAVATLGVAPTVVTVTVAEATAEAVAVGCAMLVIVGTAVMVGACAETGDTAGLEKTEPTPTARINDPVRYHRVARIDSFSLAASGKPLAQHVPISVPLRHSLVYRAQRHEV